MQAEPPKAEPPKRNRALTLAVVAGLLFIEGVSISGYILAFAMIVDPRLEGARFWKEVLDRAFLGERALWMSLGLVSLLTSAAILARFLIGTAAEQTRWFYVGLAVLVAPPIVMVARLFLRLVVGFRDNGG